MGGMNWTIRHSECGKRGLVVREFGQYSTREAAAAWIVANVKTGHANYEPVRVEDVA